MERETVGRRESARERERVKRKVEEFRFRKNKTPGYCNFSVGLDNQKPISIQSFYPGGFSHFLLLDFNASSSVGALPSHGLGVRRVGGGREGVARSDSRGDF